MVSVAPVDAWVVRQAWATAVVGHAYDGLRPEQRRQLADANPDSFFNVVRSAGDYGDDEVPDDLLDRNVRALERLLEADRFRPPRRRAFYVYHLRSVTHRQWAVVGDVPVAAFLGGEVRAHERTREHKEVELAGHLARLRMSSSPVGLTYRAAPSVDRLVEEACRTEPLVDFVSDDGVGQAVWEVPDALEGPLRGALDTVGSAYIVDGHHRVAAAARLGEPVFFAGLVPHDQLRLLPYHRLVTGPLPLPQDEVVARLAARASAEPVDRPGPGEIGIYVGGLWFRAELRRHGRDGPTTDVEAVSDQVLGPLAGITDLRTDARLEFVPGTVPVGVLMRLTDQSHGLAVTVHPPTVEQLFAEADASRVLPPKSTWFEPKFHSGVFVVRRPPTATEQRGSAAPAGISR